MRPIQCSVNIPLTELSNRLFELPPPYEVVSIASTGSEADSALALLSGRARLASVEPKFAFGPNESKPRLWCPPRFLQESSSGLGTPGRALCLACGAGREAVFLKTQGWVVTAIDLLPDALEQGHRLEEIYSLPEPAIEWIVGDLNQVEVRAKFDLICMFLYFNPDVSSRLSNWMKPSGRVLLETFSTTHRELTGKPANPNLALPGVFNASLFRNLQPAIYEEYEERGRSTIRADLKLRSKGSP